MTDATGVVCCVVAVAVRDSLFLLERAVDGSEAMKQGPGPPGDTAPTPRVMMMQMTRQCC